jgi:hypothetical protein
MIDIEYVDSVPAISLKDIWEIDGLIKTYTDERNEAMRQAAAPFQEEIDRLQAQRDDAFDAAILANAPPEVYPFGTLRIEIPEKKTPRSIDDGAFVRLFPEHLATCANVKILVSKAEKVLSAEDFARVVIQGETVYGAPILRLVEPPAPMVMPGATPRRKKSEILRERGEC